MLLNGIRHPISSPVHRIPDPGWWLGAVNRSTRCASRVPRTESLILEILKPSYLLALAKFRCRGAIIAPDSAWVCGRATNEKPMPKSDREGQEVGRVKFSFVDNLETP